MTNSKETTFLQKNAPHTGNKQFIKISNIMD